MSIGTYRLLARTSAGRLRCSAYKIRYAAIAAVLACFWFWSIGVLDARLAGNTNPRSNPQVASDSPTSAESKLDARDNPTDYSSLEAAIDTDQGQIIIEFFPKDAPHHVEYFVNKAREGAYDQTAFHRLYKYGLIQGGDP
jgi:hypothetical protein